MKARELNRKIETLGGQMVRQRGSHRRYQALTPKGEAVYTVVPQHGGDIPKGTLAAISRDLAPAFGKGWEK